MAELGSTEHGRYPIPKFKPKQIPSACSAGKFSSETLSTSASPSTCDGGGQSRSRTEHPTSDDNERRGYENGVAGERRGDDALARARTDRIGSKAGFVSVFPVACSLPARLPSTHYRVDHQLVEIQTAVRIGQVGDNASPHIGSIVTRTRRQDVN